MSPDAHSGNVQQQPETAVKTKTRGSFAFYPRNSHFAIRPAQGRATDGTGLNMLMAASFRT